MLRILGITASINVRKVLWTCDEIGLSYLREDWGGGTRPTSQQEFRDLNPHAMIPVLVDGATVIRESNTICRYLAGSAGRYDLLPPEPVRRAAVEEWMDWQATDFNNAWRYAFQALVRQSPDHRDPDCIERSIKQWNDAIAVIAEHLERNPGHIAGDGFTLADIVIGLSLNRWMRTPFGKDVPASISDYLDRLGRRPAFRQYAAYI